VNNAIGQQTSNHLAFLDYELTAMTPGLENHVSAIEEIVKLSH
jgi:hypothetical protein